MGCCGDEDEDKRNEPNERTCTDIFWLCLFITFWCLMVIIAAFSFVYGNPLRIINGYDSFGNTCGSSYNRKVGNLEFSGIDTSDKPYLLFYNISALKNSLQICVKECPRKTLYTIDDIYNYYQNYKVNLCEYNFDLEEIKRRDGKSLLSSSFGPCPVVPVYESVPVLKRCVPKPLKEVSSSILNNVYGLLNSWDTLEQTLGDLYSTWKEILALTILALVVSLLTVSILHLVAHLVSYIIMILFAIASILGTAFLWYTYYDITQKLNKSDQNTLLLEAARNETAFLYFSIIATIITVVILLIVIFLRKQVDFLANLFKETSKCLAHIPTLFFQPLLTFIILLAFFMFWIFVVLCLATSYKPGTTAIAAPFIDQTSSFTTHSSNGIGRPLSNDSFIDKIKKLTVVEYIDASWVKYMWWVYFLGLIWTSEFIMACQQMVIAGAVAHWFYKEKYKDHCHVTYAICKLIKYHLGSVALGSLVITIVKVPRLILTYLHERLKYNKDKGSECASCALKCCICCFYCLEKFLRYLNHNAYTVIAIDGSNFCSAAGTAFEVLSSHAVQVATINSIGDFILFLGKCLVTAITGTVGLYVFRKDPELHFFAAPTLVVCIFAFFVAHCILSLYEMVLDTVYLCMCQNGDAPDGIQMQNMGITDNGNNKPVTPEMEPMK